ncbi:hypothetical protein BJV78DRAFT_1355029 [Lactifluus subvellereus]|nr:hypothetical protein BJV78DRAFT_1355029 [Lactifluus subvellereus]
MFEKFSIRDIDSGGRGGEYTVQAGFGWTNGVALWVASVFGDQLVAPESYAPTRSFGPAPVRAAGRTARSSLGDTFITGTGMGPGARLNPNQSRLRSKVRILYCTVL